MSIKTLAYVWKHSKQKGARLLALLAIADSANEDGWCWLGMEKIAQKARQSATHTRTYVRAIAADGEIIIYDRKTEDGEFNYSNLYRVVMPDSDPTPPPDLRGTPRQRRPHKSVGGTHKIVGGDTHEIVRGVPTESWGDPLQDPSSDPEKIVAPATPDSCDADAVVLLPGDDPAFDEEVVTEYPCAPADVNALIAAWWEWVPVRPVKRGKVVAAKEHFANRENRAYAENLVKRGVAPADFAAFLGEIRFNQASPYAYLKDRDMTFCYVAPIVEEWVQADRAENSYAPESPRITPKRPGVRLSMNMDAPDALEQLLNHPDVYVDVPRAYISPQAIADDDAADSPIDLSIIKDIPL